MEASFDSILMNDAISQSDRFHSGIVIVCLKDTCETFARVFEAVCVVCVIVYK